MEEHAMTVKVGVLVPQGWHLDLEDIKDPVAQYEAMTRVGVEAERLGYDSIWLYDHFHTVPSPELETTFECWIVTATLARDTSRIRIGQMVTCNGYRNPAHLAKIASTVDVASKGRLDFGIGGGWYEHEYRAYGYAFPDVPERLKMLGEALQVIHALWEEDYADRDGKYYQVHGAINEPKGVQKPHIPIWIGGGGEKVTLKLVAQYGDACNVGGVNPELYTRKYGILKEHCETVGRDYNSIIKSAEVFTFLLKPGQNANDVTAKVRRDVSRLAGHDVDLPEFLSAGYRGYPSVFVGSPQQCIDVYGKLIDVGVEYIIAYLGDVVHLDTLQMFAEEVIAAFK
jgi:F420-dependent oxidoreductase-like protein